ncbi:P-loop containing nucleoside triphosphate hydrolase protein [Kockovaella imperatae]|uniref:ATP-dependent RNA helicase n=1 Tax=Kockovaella imperatae TaxID=4999 RepID=A0A1Y1UP06_9TREE|nr:P-loop containing nucleoside triphosphate hydrolase protein [Kockovaella imperatae]ORX38845.1 P-loop containing nucleoside triphosphate hydrolase protein [Kockovaella imperatae]
MIPRLLATKSSSVALGQLLGRRSIQLSRTYVRCAAVSVQNPSLLSRSTLKRFYVAESTNRKPDEAEPPNAPTSAADASGEKTDIVPFESLQGRINPNILKALVFKPFQLSAMSKVQKRVLKLMPWLVGGQYAEDDSGDPSIEEVKKRGRQDLVVKAKTGTGKTLAFLIPAIEARLNQLQTLSTRANEDGRSPDGAQQGQARRNVSRSHVGALIISPTRELATQIANEALKVCTWTKDFEVRLLVGGESRGFQLRNWSRGRKDIVVATPGRLCDLLSEPDVAEAVQGTDLLILDEADTLLEMGFTKDLNFIIDHLPKKRQTFLFSATVSKEIHQIARRTIQDNHQFIDCVPKDESNVHLHVPQFATVLKSEADQIPHIIRLIAHDQFNNPDNSKIILFLPTTKLTMLYATLMRELNHNLPNKVSVHEIHSRLDQNQRSRASERFRRDTRPSILVTSDVSARGVDYPNVTRVIQVGIPSSATQYIHRVGRTGRAGKEGGRGDLVLMPWEQGFMREMRQVPIKTLPSDELKSEVMEMAKKKVGDEGVPALEGIDEAVQNLMPSLDPTAIEEVFASMLGYYIGHASELRLRPDEILEGLEQWAVLTAGQPKPPYMSEHMLAKIGINRRNGYGSRRIGGGTGSFGRSIDDDGESRGGFGARSSGGSGSRYGDRGRYGGDRGGRGGYGGGRNSYGGQRGSFGDDRGSYGGGRGSFGGSSGGSSGGSDF